MYAWCDICNAVRLFFYRFTEQHYQCDRCGKIEKYPVEKPPAE